MISFTLGGTLTRKGRCKNLGEKHGSCQTSEPRVQFSGANNHLTPEMVEKSEPAFPASDLVVVGLEVSHDAIIRLEPSNDFARLNKKN